MLYVGVSTNAYVYMEGSQDMVFLSNTANTKETFGSVSW